MRFVVLCKQNQLVSSEPHPLYLNSAQASSNNYRNGAGLGSSRAIILFPQNFVIFTIHNEIDWLKIGHHPLYFELIMSALNNNEARLVAHNAFIKNDLPLNIMNLLIMYQFI